MTLIFPSFPRLVVIRITPLAALEPYIDAEAASFRTDMFSISLTSRPSIEPSRPSTKIRGFALLSVPIPLIRIVPPSPPGRPELCVTVTPGATPCNAIEAFITGLEANVLPPIASTAPVRLIFF